KRKLHTLKGNAGIFGFRSVAEKCHDLEEALAERGGVLRAAEAADLTEKWRKRIAGIEDFFSDRPAVVAVREGDYRSLLARIMARSDHGELFAQVRSWRWQRTLDRLLFLKAQAERLALKLGKEIAVSLDDRDLRIPPNHLDAFWAELVHVIRNA